MEVVLDVNVWVSALLWGGVPRQVVDLAGDNQIKIYASESLFLELETTLRRSKFQPKILTLNTNIEDLLRVVKSLLNWCEITSLSVPELRDPKDTIILATAIAAKVQVLITGDQDLLILQKFRGISILTPQDYLKNIIQD